MKDAFDYQLSYSGKVPVRKVLTTPARGSWTPEMPQENPSHLFCFGDNLQGMAHLLPRYKGSVDLIYIDPPFGTGQDFSRPNEAVAYTDPVLDATFLEFIRQRLLFLREFLSPKGSIYLHIDKKAGHYLKILMDEVFGQQNFLNDISRIKCNPKNFRRKAYGNFSDMILFYAKERDQHIWRPQKEALKGEEVKRLFPRLDKKEGPYTTHPLHAPGETKDGDTGKIWKGLKPPPGRHWRYSRKVLDELDKKGMIEWSNSGNPRKKVFARNHKGKKIQDVWEFKDRGLSYVSYPTEKNHRMLQRLILQSSLPESLVMDIFAGSGSFLVQAAKMGRYTLGMDQSPKALSTISDHFTKENLDLAIHRHQPS
ncbi:MAG: site-specific DNA-methyltransferase [Bacteroidota bacterium]